MSIIVSRGSGWRCSPHYFFEDSDFFFRLGVDFDCLLLSPSLFSSRWFGAEVVGSQLDLEPRRWRNPKKMDKKLDEKRLKEFRNGWGWDSVDWTKMLK